tara:strand:+ start:79 stop:399 length:321 start_codon:yes stop_codon:yes gene_type:complete
MDFYISIYTLKKIDNLLNNYKKNILKDFYDNFLDDSYKENMNYQEFENKFIERKKKFIIKNKNINYDKCHAYIWKKEYGKVQCSNNKTVNNFCKFHCKKQNYGTIN